MHVNIVPFISLSVNRFYLFFINFYPIHACLSLPSDFKKKNGLQNASHFLICFVKLI